MQECARSMQLLGARLLRFRRTSSGKKLIFLASDCWSPDSANALHCAVFSRACMRWWLQLRLMNMEQPAPAATPAQHNSTQRKEHSHPKLLHAPRCPPRRACHQGLWSLDCRDVPHSPQPQRRCGDEISCGCSRQVRCSFAVFAVFCGTACAANSPRPDISTCCPRPMPSMRPVVEERIPADAPLDASSQPACSKPEGRGLGHKDAHASTGQASAGRGPPHRTFEQKALSPSSPVPRPCRFVVLGIDVARRWRAEAVHFFFCFLSACRARAAPPHAAASERLLAFAAARSFAASPWSLPLHGTANVDGLLPDLSDMLAEHRLDNPPHASRLPAR